MGGEVDVPDAVLPWRRARRCRHPSHRRTEERHGYARRPRGRDHRPAPYRASTRDRPPGAAAIGLLELVDEIRESGGAVVGLERTTSPPSASKDAGNRRRPSAGRDPDCRRSTRRHGRASVRCARRPPWPPPAHHRRRRRRTGRRRPRQERRIGGARRDEGQAAWPGIPGRPTGPPSSTNSRCPRPHPGLRQGPPRSVPRRYPARSRCRQGRVPAAGPARPPSRLTSSTARQRTVIARHVEHRRSAGEIEGGNDLDGLGRRAVVAASAQA